VFQRRPLFWRGVRLGACAGCSQAQITSASGAGVKSQALREEVFALQLTRPGSVNNLVVRTVDIQRFPVLVDDHVELKVQAAGLNFRDVLNVLNLDPTLTVRPLGLECASVVQNAGRNVVNVSPGACIFGMAMGCLASRCHSDARYQVRMPRALSFEKASTLPILWCTNRLALAVHAAGRKAKPSDTRHHRRSRPCGPRDCTKYWRICFWQRWPAVQGCVRTCTWGGLHHNLSQRDVLRVRCCCATCGQTSRRNPIGSHKGIHMHNGIRHE
jgi:hypothetical protein